MTVKKNQWFGLVFGLATLPAYAGNWTAKATFDSRLFPESPLQSAQSQHGFSASVTPEYYHQWGATTLTMTPFLRVDSADNERTHTDIREAYIEWSNDHIEASVGLRKIYWGVTESQHLVDIINQTDHIEAPDGEEKLGQPMVSFSLSKEWGDIDLYLLPYFRERTFVGEKGRLRSQFIIDPALTTYESSDNENHLDTAVRYSHTLGEWEVGLSYFTGTGRSPELSPATNSQGNGVLAPRYIQIQQLGLDAQLTLEDWLFKLEVIDQKNNTQDFTAFTAGFEYSFYGVFGSIMDIGLITEWLHDSRGKQAKTPFNEDLMLGVRLVANDTDSTELIAGIITDLNNQSTVATIEASTRWNEVTTVSIEGFVNGHINKNDLLYDQRKDGYLQVSINYYY